MSLLSWSPPSRVMGRAAVLGLVLLGSSAAWATGNFPPVVRSELGLSAVPSCTLCHQGTPQVGTVTTPVGMALRARGLVFYDEAALKKALGSLKSEAVDSDGDGLSDVEELLADRDPNRADVVAPDGSTTPVEDVLPEPSYGCGAAPGTLPLGLMSGLLLLLRRRR